MHLVVALLTELAIDAGSVGYCVAFGKCGGHRVDIGDVDTGPERDEHDVVWGEPLGEGDRRSRRSR
jgi:hypothetical protein